jgi:hypothetical protein
MRFKASIKNERIIVTQTGLSLHAQCKKLDEAAVALKATISFNGTSTKLALLLCRYIADAGDSGGASTASDSITSSSSLSSSSSSSSLSSSQSSEYVRLAVAGLDELRVKSPADAASAVAKFEILTAHKQVSHAMVSLLYV